MSFCPQCGQQVADGLRFCSNCGAQQVQDAPATQSQTTTVQPTDVRKLHCPNCRSTNIVITTEDSVSGALTTGSGHIAATTVETKHRNYWICCDCGTKFRNIQNLEEELAKAKKAPVFVGIWFALALAVTIYLLINSANNPFGGFLMLPFTFIAGITALVTFVFIFVYKNRAKKLEQELDYLKEYCFN